LQHETVADDANVRTVAEDFAEPSEEVRPVAGQLLGPLRQREIEPLGEILDARLGFAIQRDPDDPLTRRVVLDLAAPVSSARPLAPA